ncbi:MAG: leucyl aminopeptidase family protein [Anaerolineales bacterium]|nr:leucyl aminopeptidase family protein [Chloroflexota bacterium]MBL6983743.1 leucyl aminopeptidase family protein [Anaerolineales bacterium]
MSELQLPPRLKIEPTPQSAWDGNFHIKPEPSNKSGDLLLKESGKRKTLSISLGSQEKLSSAVLRNVGVKTGKWLTGQQISAVGLSATEFETLAVNNALEAFCEGLLIGAFRFDRHKSDVETPKSVTVHVLTEGETSSLSDKIARVVAIVNGVNLAREWSHEPANIINPITLGERTKALAASTGLKCTILGEKELSEMGAGAIQSVGLGSKTPSQMIILEHQGTQKDSPPVVIVGKAITFDTGGYSLKDKAGIVGMKFDKCGGMDVIGIMQAVADLDLPIPVIGIVAAAENMISQDAYRPNDIITSLSGKTIEIISTDAEGRMVLADALTYAAEQYKPRAIIDLATLTGGVRTALGSVRAGLMSNNDQLADALFQAGESTNERLWRLPLDDEYFDLIKGTDSDIKNSAGGPSAAPIVGGMFLKQFVPDEIPWVHIDIAGTATIEKSKGIRLATGFGVRLVVEFLTTF